MTFKKAILLVASMALAPMTAWPLEVGATVATPVEPTVAPSLAPLSTSAQGVVKMVNAGLPEDVIKAYIENSSAAFVLTAENIIDLQKNGVPGGLLAAMLNRDKVLKESIQVVPTAPAPVVTQPATVNPQTVMPSDEAIYNNLAPYGSWNYQVGYGWGWQPYAWVGYGSYPWGWLGYGYWGSVPNYGRCWFPRSHFQNFHGVYGRTAFGHYNGNYYSPYHGNYYNQYRGNYYNHYNGSRSAFGAAPQYRGNQGVARTWNAAGYPPSAFRSSANFNHANTSYQPRMASGGSAFRGAAHMGGSAPRGGSFGARSGGGGSHGGGGGSHGGGRR